MNCNEIRELLSLYIDNNLDEEQMIEIEKHLLICAACKKEFEEFDILINTMKNLPEVKIPTQFDSRLREELKKGREMNRKTSKKALYIRYSSIAAIFVIGIFSIAMYNTINSGKLNTIEQLPPSQDAMKMMATPSLEDSSKELDQAMNDYVKQLDELYKGEPYVLLDWTIDSDQIYMINIQVETTSPAGDVSYETISYRGQDGKLWKTE